MMTSKLTLGSLFDGSGGFPLAGALLGIEPVWASEIEPYPLRVTAARFPGMIQLGDITKINGAAIPAVDIITFGSPCQDLSTAGRRAGLQEGSRSSLFFEAIRVIKEMREATNGKTPRFLVWENVKGALSSAKGADFRIALEYLCRVKDPSASIPQPEGKWGNAGSIVGDGYSLAWRIYDAQYWGVPQHRERLFLVVDLGGERAGEVFFKPESLSRYSEPGQEAWERIAGHSEEGLVPDYVLLEHHPMDCRIKIAAGDVCQTLSERMGTGGGGATCR